ncbi:unnamed protein product [Closterium sp. NIES-54]
MTRNQAPEFLFSRNESFADVMAESTKHDGSLTGDVLIEEVFGRGPNASRTAIWVEETNTSGSGSGGADGSRTGRVPAALAGLMDPPSSIRVLKCASPPSSHRIAFYSVSLLVSRDCTFVAPRDSLTSGSIRIACRLRWLLSRLKVNSVYVRSASRCSLTSGSIRLLVDCSFRGRQTVYAALSVVSLAPFPSCHSPAP